MPIGPTRPIPTLRFQTLLVFFLISHDRRRIVHWNVTAHPTKIWVWRQLIAATPWGIHPHFLIRDRDAAYGRDFAPKAALCRPKTPSVLPEARVPLSLSVREMGDVALLPTSFETPRPAGC